MSSNNTAQLPPTKRQLRACMLCSLIKTAAQFRDFGCDNCESILKLTRSTERINDCTTTQFEGMIALTKPRESWIARWLRTDNFKKGLYACQVYGVLPDYIVDELSKVNIEYFPRDGSYQDALLDSMNG